MYSTGVVTSMWESLGFTGRLKYSKRVLHKSGLSVYLCCAELPDYDAMLRELHLTDTFNSWVRLLQLHIWMCMVRLTPEGREGKFIRNSVLNFLWQDINKKSKKLGELASFSSRAEGLQAISEQFKSSLFAYDEGLMGNDHVLAGALWRNLFDKNCADVSHLEQMVEYVRRQLAHLDKLESSELLITGLMRFLPLHETTENFNRQKLILTEITKRVLL
jgi:cytochrome b pre-mRNA-processing protein 3